MRIPPASQRKRARIEIIPLIDIVFFLLATFVMVSLSMIKNEGMSVNLPTAATGTAQERKNYTTISVTNTGEVYLDKRKIRVEDVASEVKILKDREPELQIFIQGDESAHFGTAMKVLDSVRSLGISKVAVQTKPAEETKS